MDDLTPMEPEYQEASPETVDEIPCYYGTGRLPKQTHSHTALIVSLVALLVGTNLVTLLVLLGRAKQQTATVDPQPSDHATISATPTIGEAAIVEPTEARTGGNAELKISNVQTESLSLPEIYDKIMPSIGVVTAESAEDTTTGTAVIMSAEGYLITNAHTVLAAEEISVLLSDGESYSAELTGIDQASDLAVLKIDAEQLPTAEFGDSDALRAGDAVVAISNPFGALLSGTMSDGIIAAVNREVTISGRSISILQTTAALRSESACGPLLNSSGQVIGINVAYAGTYNSYETVDSIGFAIPIQEAREILHELIANGYVSGRASLGIEVGEIPELQRLYWELPDGMIVNAIHYGSNAYYAGLRTGDVVLSIDDEPVTDQASYRSVLSEFSAGDCVRVIIYREGKKYYADIILNEAGLFE